MKIETVNLKVPVYFVQGMHTCAQHFGKGDVCLFRMALSFGQRDTCYWLQHNEELDRTEEGFLIPDKRCPLTPLITAEAERLSDAAVVEQERLRAPSEAEFELAKHLGFAAYPDWRGYVFVRGDWHVWRVGGCLDGPRLYTAARMVDDKHCDYMELADGKHQLLRTALAWVLEQETKGNSDG